MIEGDKTECAIGEYNDKEKQLICFNCESGYICNKTANVAHEKCPIGYECNDPINPNLCPPGTNATQLGQTTCPLCDPGFNCENPTNPYECSSGTYETENRTVCAPCEPGHYCLSGFQFECQVGTYQSLMATTRCDKCPKNRSCDGKALTNYMNCPPLRFSMEFEYLIIYKATRPFNTWT